MRTPLVPGFLLAIAFSLAHIPASAQTAPIAQRLFPADSVPQGSSVDPAVYRRAANSVVHFPACTGVVVRGGYLVTARHCAVLWRYMPSLSVEVDSPYGKEKLRLESLPQTIQPAPFDAAVYRIIGFTGVPAELRADPVRPDEPVFGVAYYDGAKRSFSGRIAVANEAKASYCRFSNEDDARPLTWKLEPSCPSASGIGPGPREERDPLLASAPMAEGMSGGPLFDMQGRVVGIASNVLNDAPAQYDPAKYGVYVKAANILPLIPQPAAAPADAPAAAEPPAERHAPAIRLPGAAGVFE